MVQSAASGSPGQDRANAADQGDGRSSEKSGSGKGSIDGLEQFIDVLIKQIELVSKHFGYTEEYVLSHTPAWLNRKFNQYQREMYAEHQEKVMAGFQSALLVLDAVFNKGKEFNKILPPSLDEVMKQQKEQHEINDQFVQGVWWGSNAPH